MEDLQNSFLMSKKMDRFMNVVLLFCFLILVHVGIKEVGEWKAKRDFQQAVDNIYTGTVHRVWVADLALVEVK